MKAITRFAVATLAVAALLLALALPALAAKEKTFTETTFEQGTTTTTTCTKVKGQWVCETTEQPGKNQGGVGSSDETTTQGNLSNFSPEPQGVGEEDLGCNPPSSNGKPCNP
jgi:hypothetical protein